MKSKDDWPHQPPVDPTNHTKVPPHIAASNVRPQLSWTWATGDSRLHPGWTVILHQPELRPKERWGHRSQHYPITCRAQKCWGHSQTWSVLNSGVIHRIFQNLQASLFYMVDKSSGRFLTLKLTVMKIALDLGMVGSVPGKAPRHHKVTCSPMSSFPSADRWFWTGFQHLTV